MDDQKVNGSDSFSIASAQLRNTIFRTELAVREIPAPQHSADSAIAFAAQISHTHGMNSAVIHESAYGAGRLLLMHDENSADEWGSPFRIVCFAQAPLEHELATDPFIAQVAWSWLLDALEHRQAEYSYISGTATKTISAGFGELAAHSDTAQLEIRASWTPLGTDFRAHAEAWAELLCVLAGYPHHEGVASLEAKRTRHNSGRGE